MIVNDRITEYIKSLEPQESPLIYEIGKEARENGVPVIREETAAFLKTMTAAMKPKAILEVGTAVGYSTLLMAEAMGSDCQITTIEKYEKRILIASRNFEKAGKTDCITLLEGDAGEILKGLTGPFDLVFMDAAKGQYLTWLPQILKVMRVGGMLISDNVLQDGDIIESRYAVERRNRTIHGRMREYLYELKHSDNLTTTIVPIGDGITVSVRI
ncbi:O-methyltransferase [Lacrimispora algidixylanolytica]|uniref:tRNA 5-hydroxyuridine methyltransferase n=1 Tax=Lacrimispora algidixylanolytica TaxID=94868 RepID=A0A419T3K9_9FIRM|nr:O-methyltransferase [Lacrimispora algidixylanolytica]RKD32130.1 methyltransferase [Lacrimispora algidixylanolytica]